MHNRAIKVLCVDDNFLVAEGIRIKLLLEGGFEWLGQLPDANRLLAEVQRLRPDIVLLDLDMPGRDAFKALEELAQAEPDVRAVIISGHARSDLVDRAVEAGAWGYISKGDGTDAIVDGIRQVMQGQFVVGPDASSETRIR
jgi:two-component system, NarL family, response regulator DesR